MDQLHLLWFIECNVGLAHNIRSNLALVHDLLHQRIINWSYVIWVIISLQDSIQDGVTHIERGMLLALLQDFSKDSVTLLLPENALEGWGNEDQNLENFDRVLSDVQVVNLDQVHYDFEAVQFQQFVQKWVFLFHNDVDEDDGQNVN